MSLPAIRRGRGCGRCGADPHGDDRHTTRYSDGRGLFPLCVACFEGLTPAQRLVWYEVLLAWWYEDGWDGAEHEAIRTAVLEGK